MKNQKMRIYDENHQLHVRFTPITSVPLELWLGRSAKLLKQWIHKIQDQIRMTQIINELDQDRQLTI
jgi:hypothetical protein